jgi:hypothetical protein
MAVNETRVSINLIDNASSKLQSLNSNFQGMINTLSKGSSSVSAFNSSFNSKEIENYTSAISTADSMIQRLTYSIARYTIIYKGMAGLGNIFDEFVGGAYNYGKMWETNSIGIAGILASMTQINGQQLTWNQSLGVSTTIMEKLRSEALRTSATSEDLIETFRAILGPGLAGGMNIDQITKLTTIGVNAVKSLGLPHNQLIQELRDLVQGGIRPSSSTLATALGIKDADVEAAKQSSEGLFKFLMDRMQGFEKSVVATSNTVTGRIERIKEAMHIGIYKSSEELYTMYSNALGMIADKLITVNANGKGLTINPEFKAQAEEISGVLIKGVKGLETVGKVAYDTLKPVVSLGGSGLGLMVSNIDKVAMGFAAWKLGGVLKDLANVALYSTNGYKATTFLGKAVNDVTDFATGATSVTNQLVKATNDLNTFTQQYANTVGGLQSVREYLKGNENSVLNLTEKYKAMGVSANGAGMLQEQVLRTLTNYGVQAAKEMQNVTDSVAKQMQLLNEIQRLKSAAGTGMIGASGTVHADINAQRSELANVQGGNRSTESVLRLAETYKKLGVSAQEAGNMQLKVQQAVLSGSYAVAEQIMKENEEYALSVSAKSEAAKVMKQAYNEQLSAIREIALAEQMLSKQRTSVEKFMTSKSATTEQVATTKELIGVLQQAGLEEKQIYTMVQQYTQACKRGNEEVANSIATQITKSAALLRVEKERVDTQTTAVRLTKEWQSVDYSALTAQQEKLLAFDAQHILNLSSQKSQVAEVQQAYATLANAVKEGMLSESDSHKVVIALQKQVASGYVDIAAKIAEEIQKQYELGTLAKETATQTISQQNIEAEERKRILVLSAEKITQQQRELLEYDALTVAELTGNPKIVSSLKQIIANEGELERAAKERGISTEQANAAYISTLREVITTQGELNASTLQATATNLEHEASQTRMITNNGNMRSTFTELAMAVGITASAVAGLTGDTDDWLAKAADVIVNAGFVVSALSSITTALKGIETQAIMTKAAMLGVIATFVVAAAYRGKKNYDDYNSGKTAVYDEMGNIRFLGEGESPRDNETLVKAGNSTLNGVDKNDPDAQKYASNLASVIAQEKAASVAIDNITPKYKELTDAMNKSGDSASKAAEKLNKNSIVEAMRDQIGKTPYTLYNDMGEKIGTGCMYAVGIALKKAGVPSSLLSNGAFMRVPNFAEEANKLGLLHSASSGYVPKAGDVALYGGYSSNGEAYGNLGHAAVKTSTGTIQNGASQGTVYENNAAPEDQMRGSHPVAYWVETSKYATGSNGSSREISDLIDNYNKEKASVQSMTADINAEIVNVLNGGMSGYDKVMANAVKKAESYRKEMQKAANAGVDTTELQKKIDDYTEAEKYKAIEALREEENTKFQIKAESIQRQVQLGKATNEQANNQLREELNDYRNYIEYVLEDTQMGFEKRIEWEKRLASVTKQINEANAYNFKTAWASAFEDLSQRQINYKEKITSVFSDIENAGVSLLSSTASYSEKVANFFDSITTSILENMAKIIMQGLITNAILSIFGMGKSGFSFGNVGTSGVTVGGTSVGYGSILGKASGGAVSSGTYLVGEQGPEILQINGNGGVYNNADTKKMLGNTDKVNITMNVKNESGTPVKAEQTGVAFDGENYVVGVVLKAISTNKNGMRSIIKGAATS